MTTAACLPLAADRWTPFVRTIEFDGLALTGAVMRLQVRLYPDAPGAPLVDLATVTSSAAEGIYLMSDTGGGSPVSIIQIRIAQATLEALPTSGEPGDDTALAYDLVVTPTGGDLERWLYGQFTVQAGVTH